MYSDPVKLCGIGGGHVCAHTKAIPINSKKWYKGTGEAKNWKIGLPHLGGSHSMKKELIGNSLLGCNVNARYFLHRGFLIP